MRPLDQAMKLIKEFEGCAFVSYQDQAGVWTIGYGSTRNVGPGMTIDQPKADNLLGLDLIETCTRIDRDIGSQCQMTANEYQALVSFTFNEGIGHLHESTVRMKMLAGDFGAAADAFLMWDKVRGVVVPGLLRRRQAERALFLTPDAPSPV